MNRTVLLGDVVDTIIDYRGKTPKKLGSDWSLSGYRALSAKNIENGSLKNQESIRFVTPDLYKKWMKEEVQRGDILLTSEGPMGESMLWDSDEKIVLSQRLFGIRPNRKIVDPNFLYAYISSPVFLTELEARASGSTVRGIRQAELIKTKINLPDIDVQKFIGSSIKSIDEKIELNKRMSETLEKIGQTLFKHYFINNLKATKWGSVLLGQKIHPKRGKSLTSKNMVEGKIPVISGGLLPAGNHNASNTRAPVVTISASGANAGFVALWGENVWSADSSFIDPTVTNHVYFYYIFLKVNQEKIFGMQTGAAQPHIYPSHLELLEIPNAPEENMDEFNEEVSSLFDKIEKNKQEVKSLSSLRDSLLPRLISGKIKV